MKLLKITATGLPLFDGKCEIDFLAMQRVTEENSDRMNCLFTTKGQDFYQNNVLSFIGINASGKTTILKLITFVCRMLNNEPINGIDCREFLDGMNENNKVVLESFFFTKEKSIQLLHTEIIRKNNKFVIADEWLKSKSLFEVSSKKKLFCMDGFVDVMSRDNNEAFLLDDVSIMVAINKKTNDLLAFTDMLRYTNTNQLSISENCPPELIAFFDPSIESLTVQGSGKDIIIRLRFKNKDEIKLNQLSDLNRYLSSGTIKGINTFLNAIKTFETGGYLIIDELENHFNHEIVSTLLRFYMDKKINQSGAVLIFSTHYSELLDEFERNDNIYIVRNRGGIATQNLSAILKRNDIKKSEAYESGFLDGTVPMYDAYMDLKKSIMRAHKEG